MTGMPILCTQSCFRDLVTNKSRSQLEDTQNLEYSLPASLTNANVDNLHNPSNGVAVPSFMPFAAQPDSNVAISSQLMAQLYDPSSFLNCTPIDSQEQF